MKEQIKNISSSQNLKRSRLPQLTKEEIEYIKGTSDFLGLNHYSTFSVSASPNDTSIGIYSSSDIGN